MKPQQAGLFVTQMKDELDGMVYPELPYETEQQAVQYATQRSSEKKCEITVRSAQGKVIGVYKGGERMPQADEA